MTGERRKSIRGSGGAGLLLGSDADEYQWYGRDAPALADDVHQVALVVGDAGGHFAFQFFHGQDFDAHVDDFGDVEAEMLYEQVVGDEGIFAELDFDGYPVFITPISMSC